MTERRLLVAVHDVTPAHADRVRRALALLDGLGIRGPALFVVPDWHGAWPLDAHPDFLDELKRRQRAGADIVLHGYRHDEDGYRRSVADRLRVFGRTAASAEFMLLAPDEAARRLDAGLELFRRLGLDPVGFVPPAWLFGPTTRQLLRARGLRVTESFARIEHLVMRHRVFAPALSWSTARWWRSQLTAHLADLRVPLERGRDLMRVAIHPPDVDTAVVRRSLERALGSLLAVRAPVAYRDVWER